MFSTRYPGTSYMDHLMRYQDNPDVKMLVVLGEVGGKEEYKIAEALKRGDITKPLVAWCIGTCAGMFTSEVGCCYCAPSILQLPPDNSN